MRIYIYINPQLKLNIQIQRLKMEINFTFSEVDKIPGAHSASFKKGIVDGLFRQNEYEENIAGTNKLSYEKGKDLGKKLLQEVRGLMRVSGK